MVSNSSKSQVSIDSDFKARRWYHRRDIRFIGLVVVFILAFQGYGFFSGPSRISPDLKEAIEMGENKFDILVSAKFPAEAFHFELYQTLGAVSGEVGGAVKLGGVSPKDIRFLSRKYWIERISLAPN